MFVKICGLTNLDDALAAVDAGAGAAGFIFCRESPRFVEPDALSGWIQKVPGTVWKVGVFVNESPARIADICDALGLDVAQLHGHESARDVPAGPRVWKAVRVSSGFDIRALDAFPAEAVLLDGPKSGTTFDWSAVSSQSRNLILAGGLDTNNVRDAVCRVRPWGIDACSHLESSPGKKDHARMRHFIQTALTC